MIRSQLRIVSLLSSATEILFGLGLGDYVVGVGHECDFPTAALSRPRLTRSLVDSSQSSEAIDQQVHERIAAGQPLYEIDHEQFEQLAPTLVITQAQCDVCAIHQRDVEACLRKLPVLKATALLALNPLSLDDVFQDIHRIGAATNATNAAAEFVRCLQARVQAVRTITDAIPDETKPVVACIEWIEPLMLAANWTPDIISWAGGKNLLTESGRHSTYVAWDDIRQHDPDAIFVAPCGFDLSRTECEARRLSQFPGWSELRAVCNGRVFMLDGNAYFNRSGPRLVDSLEIAAHRLYPDIFPTAPA